MDAQVRLTKVRGGLDPGAPRASVLVTGGAGYIGSPLVRRLLGRGYRVRVLDSLLYGGAALRGVRANPRLELVVGDVRDPVAVARAVAGVEAVVHLAGIVGDPACALDPTTTIEINVEATRLLADACHDAGVPRLLFASSCSVYGASERVLDETSALNPVSLYAETKIDAEVMLLARPRAACAPVILRFATAYGASLRPRFDLAVNLLTAKALHEGRITIHGGDQWRPFVHVDDIGRALILALEEPRERVAGQVLNVGATAENYRLEAVGALIRAAVPTAEVLIDAHAFDPRNYYVRFDAIADLLGFVPGRTLQAGIADLAARLRRGVGGDPANRRTDNHRFLRETGGVPPLRPQVPAPLAATG